MVVIEIPWKSHPRKLRVSISTLMKLFLCLWLCWAGRMKRGKGLLFAHSWKFHQPMLGHIE
jgi:hypothetical protein